MTTKPTTLTEDQLRFYQEEGYLHLKNVLTAETLETARSVLAGWVSEQVHGWRDGGLISDLKETLPLETRLLVLWRDAGKPKYLRSPRRDLVGEAMYRLLAAPELLDIAEDLLGTPELSVHGIFNARAKMPDQAWTNTPWHQDAQYFREAEHRHVPTFWFPLQDVDEESSCLQVEPRYHRNPLHEGYQDEASGFVGLAPEITEAFRGLPIPMNLGDVLCFTEKTPHRATANRKEIVRWSLDFRYEDTDHATPEGSALGFVARSRDPGRVTSCDDWLKKWEDRPKGSY